MVAPTDYLSVARRRAGIVVVPPGLLGLAAQAIASSCRHKRPEVRQTCAGRQLNALQEWGERRPTMIQRAGRRALRAV